MSAEIGQPKVRLRQFAFGPNTGDLYALDEQGRFWVHLNPAGESIYTITLPVEDSGDAV